MASLNFPSSPTIGQTYVSGDRTWTWNGVSWSGISATTVEGPTGPSGTSGFSGISGASGISGFSGTGTSGFSGYSGISGTSGISGFSGTGTSGFSGYSGTGTSGFSGYSGISGPSGSSGSSGYSGYSGLGYDGIISLNNISFTAGSTGSRTFNVLEVKALAVGTRIRVAAVAVPGAFFEGSITSISSTTITMAVDYSVIGGTYGSWTVSVAGAIGQSGYSGAGISGFSGTAGTGLTAGSASVGYINYNGTTKTAGQMDGGTTNPTNTTRLNYDGYLYATRFYGDGSQLSGVSAGATITDDTTTNATRYILFDDITSGSATSVGVSSTKLYFNPSSGTLYATVFQSLSDANKKTNITLINDAVSKLDQINGVEFDWLDSGKKSAGVIAQEIEQVLPHLVEEWDGVKSVNYSGLIAYLIESNKELARRISALENK